VWLAPLTSSGGQKDAPIEKPLLLTLEEAYRGCTKKIRISKTVRMKAWGKGVSGSSRLDA
jgi:hypothetical protein